MMDAAETQAAQRDLAIAAELEAIRQANQDLEQRLAMDVYFVETTNDGINLCNDHTLPVLKAITGQDLGVEPEKWKSWWTDQLGYAYQSELPDTKPTYADFVAATSLVRSLCIPRASPPVPWFKRSTARGRSRRSGSAIESCRRGPRPVSSRFSPWWPPIAIRQPPRCGSRSAANRSSRPASTASGRRAKAGRWPASSRPAID